MGDDADRRITERGGLALDVVGGAEQRIVRLLGEAGPFEFLSRRFEPFAFGMHPAGEFVR
jgi:hypothetical protein